MKTDDQIRKIYSLLPRPSITEMIAGIGPFTWFLLGYRTAEKERGEHYSQYQNMLSILCDTFQIPGAQSFESAIEWLKQHGVKTSSETKRQVYMVHVNAGGSVFVKELDYFKSQGGFEHEWGKHWVPLVASSVPEARKLGCKLPGARPYERQVR